MKKIIFIPILLIATFFISVLIFIPDSPFGRDVKDFFTINKKISIDEYEKVVSENKDLKVQIKYLDSLNSQKNDEIYSLQEREYLLVEREEELVANYNNLIDQYKRLERTHNELFEISEMLAKSIRNSQQSAAINNLIKSLGGNRSNQIYSGQGSGNPPSYGYSFTRNVPSNSNCPTIQGTRLIKQERIRTNKICYYQ